MSLVKNQNPSCDFKYVIGRCPKCNSIVCSYDGRICKECGEKLEFYNVDDYIYMKRCWKHELNLK